MKRSLQSILYLPHFLSWVIVVALFQQMLGNAGMLNTFLVQNDLAIVQIIGDPELFKALVTSQVIWKDAGWAHDHLPGGHVPHRPGAVRGRRRGRGVGWQRHDHITLPALKGCSSCCSSSGSAAACRSASSRSSCNRDRSACRPARYWTPGSTTTASSAATGGSRPRPGCSRDWSVCCSCSGPTSWPTSSANEECTKSDRHRQRHHRRRHRDAGSRQASAVDGEAQARHPGAEVLALAICRSSGRDPFWSVIVTTIARPARRADRLRRAASSSWPNGVSFSAYRAVLSGGVVTRAMFIFIGITVVGHCCQPGLPPRCWRTGCPDPGPRRTSRC